MPDSGNEALVSHPAMDAYGQLQRRAPRQVLHRSTVASPSRSQVTNAVPQAWTSSLPSGGHLLPRMCAVPFFLVQLVLFSAPRFMWAAMLVGAVMLVAVGLMVSRQPHCVSRQLG
jgi:hypothetical protein